MNYIDKIMNTRISKKKFIGLLGSFLLVILLFPKSVMANLIGMRFNSTGSSKFYFDTSDDTFYWYINGTQVAKLENV